MATNGELLSQILQQTLESVSLLRDMKGDTQNLAGMGDLAKAIDDHRKAIDKNTETLGGLSGIIQNMGQGGQAGNRPSNGLPLTPSQQGEGVTGLAAVGGVDTNGTGEYTVKQGYGGAMQRAKHGDFLGAAELAIASTLRTPTGQVGALALGAVPGGRYAATQINARLERSMMQRVGSPTELGMLAGYAGPGPESFPSSVGSYASSLFAMPSMLFSGGSNPNLIGNMFGANMSSATSAGYEAKYRAISRSINPFDMLTYGQSMDIVKATSAKGFRTLGQQVSVEQAVSDLVQSIGVEAGAAIDMLDLAVKRLGIDADDGKRLLSDFGGLAKGAAKGINEFFQEVAQVTNRASALGARGTGAIGASAMYAGFSQVGGTDVFSFLNSPQLLGLQAASIMGGGPGSQFANPNDMLKLAFGQAPGMGGGQEASGVASSQIQSLRNLVKSMIPTFGSEDMAISAVANMTGQDPLMVRQIYKEGPQVIAQGKIQEDLSGMITGHKAAYRNLRSLKATDPNNPQAEKAFRNFRSQSKAGLSENITWSQTRLDKMRLGSKDPYFAEKIKDVMDAIESNDGAKMRGAEEKWRDRGGIDEARRAAMMMRQIGSEDEGTARQIWGKLNQEFGIGIGSWSSDSGKVPEQYRKSFQREATALVEKAYRTQAVGKGERDTLIKQLESKKGLTPAEFQKKLTEATSRQRQKENQVKIELTGDAKRYFNIFKGSLNSTKGKTAYVDAMGENLRAGIIPGVEYP
jgi:hypothetical protein